jgi:hypothetical protein
MREKNQIFVLILSKFDGSKDLEMTQIEALGEALALQWGDLDFPWFWFPGQNIIRIKAQAYWRFLK